MEAHADSGAVRSLGLSNQHDVGEFEWLYEAARHKPVVLQNRFYGTTRWDSALRRSCAARGVRYQSFWTLTGNREALGSAAVREFAASRGCTAEAAWFVFVRSLGITPLSGTTSDAHMRDDLAVAGVTSPSGAERERLMALIAAT